MSDNWVIEEIDGIQMLVEHGDDVSDACVGGYFEIEETAFLDSVIKPGMTFVDVGANIGWFSLRGARAVGPMGRVISMEPRIDTFQKLSRSMELNGFTWAHPHNVACGAEDGEMNIGWANVSGGRGGTWLLPHQELVDDFAALEKEMQLTPVRRIDDYVDGVDVLKIDIEGAEILALRGAHRTLSEYRPLILCEINPANLALVSKATAEDLIGLMASYGYSSNRLDGSGIGEPYVGGALPDGLNIINVVMRPN